MLILYGIIITLGSVNDLFKAGSSNYPRNISPVVLIPYDANFNPVVNRNPALDVPIPSAEPAKDISPKLDPIIE